MKASTPEHPRELEGWSQHARLVLWLYRDVFRQVGWTTLGLLGLSALSVGARAASVGTLVLYVKAQTAGEAAQVLGFQLPSAVTSLNLMLWGGTALLFALLTAATAFWVDHLVFRIARSYALGAARRVAGHVAAGGRVRPALNVPDGEARTLEIMLGVDVFGMVRTVTFILGLVLPLLTLAVAAGAMLKLDPLITIALLPILPVYLVPLALLNRKLARDAHVLQSLRPQLRWNVRQTLSGLAEAPDDAPEARERVRTLPDDSLMDQGISAFRDYILARRRVDNLRDVFQGAALLAILLAFGAALAREGASWAVLLTYLVALQYATRSLGQVSKFVTLTNRYVPQIQRYFAFVTGDLPDGAEDEEADELASRMAGDGSEPTAATP